MMQYRLSEAAHALSDSQRMTAHDVLDVARFALSFTVVPVLMNGLYALIACL